MDLVKKIKNDRRYQLIIVAVFAVVGAIFFVYSKAATPGSPTALVAGGSATLTLSPSSGSYAQGTNFTVGLYENSGSIATPGVEAIMTYDASKLDFVSADTSGGVFTDCPVAPSGGNGTVSFQCLKYGQTFTGNQKVGNITFKSKAGAGSAVVNFASNSGIYDASSGNIWNGATVAGAFTLTGGSGGGGGAGGSGGGTGGTGGGSGGGSGGTSNTGGGTKTGTQNTSGGSKSTTPTSNSSGTPVTANGSQAPTPVTATTNTGKKTSVVSSVSNSFNDLPVPVVAAVGGSVVLIGGAAGYILIRRRAITRMYGGSAHHNQGVVFDASKPAPKAPAQPVNNLETTVVKPAEGTTSVLPDNK